MKYKAILLFFIVLAVYLGNLPQQYYKNLDNGQYRRLLPTDDTIPNTVLPYLLIKYKTLKFDEVFNSGIISKGSEFTRPYYLFETQNGWYSSYPILPAIFAIPFYYLPIATSKLPEITYHKNIIKLLALGRLVGSFYAALSVVIFYKILNLIDGRSEEKKSFLSSSLLFTLFYAFGTATYSISSRGIWLHTFVQLFVSVSLYLLILLTKKKSNTSWLIFFQGLLLSLAVNTRVVLIIYAIAISLFVLFNYRKYCVTFILSTVPGMTFFFLYNYYTFGSFFSDGYTARGYGISDLQHWSTPLYEGITGLLVSPARGLVFISPPLLLTFFAIYSIFKNKKFGKDFNVLFRYLSIAFLLTFLLMSKWFTWHGANAFGNRMLVGMLPIMGLLSYYVIIMVGFLNSNFRKFVFTFLIVFSIYVHTNAVIFRKAKCERIYNWSFYCLKPTFLQE